MEWTKMLPAVNASLNALSGILLLTGFAFIRARRVKIHRFFMLAACTTSTIFLASYLTYHYFEGSTPFTGTGWVRTLYFAILITHTTLAVIVVPLAIASVFNGLKWRIPQHRRVARWTFPIWIYVSCTGVLVYFFLYQWFPS